MSRVVEGKVAEHWAQFDLLGVMVLDRSHDSARLIPEGTRGPRGRQATESA
jgi:hypothetical protein